MLTLTASQGGMGRGGVLKGPAEREGRGGVGRPGAASVPLEAGPGEDLKRNTLPLGRGPGVPAVGECPSCLGAGRPG